MSLKFQPINLDKRILVIHDDGTNRCLGDIMLDDAGTRYFWWPDAGGMAWEEPLSAGDLYQLADMLGSLNINRDEEIRRGLEAANRDRGEWPAADRLPGGGDL